MTTTIATSTGTRRAWWKGPRRRGARGVARQGRREARYQQISGRLRTQHRGVQRGPAAQRLFRQALLLGGGLLRPRRGLARRGLRAGLLGQRVEPLLERRHALLEA